LESTTLYAKIAGEVLLVSQTTAAGGHQPCTEIGTETKFEFAMTGGLPYEVKNPF
jgi:hypothetical protein